jgi:hypothetical protein
MVRLSGFDVEGPYDCVLNRGFPAEVKAGGINDTGTNAAEAN